MESNKKLSPIVTELFLRGGKLNISLVFYITINKIEVLETKCNTLFYHEISKQKRISTNSIKPLV